MPGECEEQKERLTMTGALNRVTDPPAQERYAGLHAENLSLLRFRDTKFTDEITYFGKEYNPEVLPRSILYRAVLSLARSLAIP